jgi:hypothetical protein
VMVTAGGQYYASLAEMDFTQARRGECCGQGVGRRCWRGRWPRRG